MEQVFIDLECAVVEASNVQDIFECTMILEIAKLVLEVTRNLDYLYVVYQSSKILVL